MFHVINKIIYNMSLPISECNSAPSIATFEPITPDSVRSRMSEQELSQMPTNGHTIETLRAFSSLNRRDKIDKLGIATKILSENAAKYSASGLRQKFYSMSQKTK